MKLNLEDIDRELAKRKLSEFIKLFWHVIEPGQYLHNWHIDVISEHLEAVANGQIRKLIINMPPRHMKSLTVAVFFPAWVWITYPEKRWLFSSYAHSLSMRDSNNCRAVIQSPLYQCFYGNIYNLLQNTVVKFSNDKGGFRLATSVGGANTGEGADIIAYDDPNNMKEIYSNVKLDSVILWHDTVMSTRLNNQETGCRIITQQRGHNKDMTGHILANEHGWEYLILPARYEGKNRSKTSIFFTDPRTYEGEPLCKNRFDDSALKDIEISLGSYGTAAQLQQRPSPLGGGVVKIAAFKRYNKPPEKFERIINSWDTAQKTGIMNDYTVCLVFGIIKKDYYLLHMIRERLEYPALKKKALMINSMYPVNLNLIEDKSSGSSLIQDSKKEIPVKAIEPEGDKLTRMYVEYAQVEAGFVHIPEKAVWLSDFELEVGSFPNAEHDDIVDAFSQFLTYIRTRPVPVMR